MVVRSAIHLLPLLPLPFFAFFAFFTFSSFSSLFLPPSYPPSRDQKSNLTPHNTVYWTPQVIGGFGFIISGTLFMLETQKKWYLPAFSVLGWHIGLWNTIGGFGFFLSPVFGYDTEHWAQYQAGCQTFYGSWAFLIGSLVQLYESLDKRVVVVDKR